ncbi:hypothetical protein QAD02_004919 [Eretmocerus hayati]|uniref:Uncharacterized protein n=1 Tax=Eretmocerus hayati TaxID=131215 RepID=A0ACC2NRB7_9HYME|nr:hypothetical protein QAD02_004919 [Eretmocerus hayati]
MIEESSRRVCALVCALLIAGAAAASSSSEQEAVSLPRSVKTCKHNTPDYSSCLRLAIQESWMTFIKGIPEIGLPPLDPLTVDRMETDFSEGEVSGKFVLHDVQTYGMANTNFLAVRPQHTGDRISLEMDITIPKVFIDGDYKIDGVVGPYKIGGKGYFNVSVDGVSATWGLEGRVENDRWIIEHFRLYPEIENLKVYFTDLFNGNEDLNKLALRFANQYWQVLYKSMLPAVMEHWDVNLTDFVNRLIFSKISASKYFP